ncbi:MAG: YicC family protein [Clostridiales bacterium]|nr:YicC family protein [Clostridiales bacterium]MDY5975767.1 YicC/YloC family endoribonuclease [Anaerovoracaceae bacterium]
MIKSMTGFGRAEYSDGKRNIIVEIKAVNHKYSELYVRIPRRYSFAEEHIKNAVKEYASRGKIDISVVVDNLTDDDVTVKLNTAIVKQYIGCLSQLREEYGLAGDIDLQFVSSLPDVMKTAPDVEDEEEILKGFLVPVREAAAGLDRMRALEGDRLSEDLIMRGRLILNMVDEIEKNAPLVAENYRIKLGERINELLSGKNVVPEERIAAEVALFADKCNITEEIVRLRSHCRQLEEIIEKSTGPCGKKLDFLVQEMNREANTICSKANFLEITNTALDVKSEIDKIREQVQNIE